MNAKYRPPAIASDQYAFLNIGAMAIGFQTVVKQVVYCCKLKAASSICKGGCGE